MNRRWEFRNVDGQPIAEVDAPTPEAAWFTVYASAAAVEAARVSGVTLTETANADSQGGTS